MANWQKKITKAVGGDLNGEQLLAGMIVHPAGMMKGMMVKQIGGLAGAAIAAKLGKGDDAELVTDSGTAGRLPNDSLVLGLTPQRLLVWSFGKLAGKPKELLLELPRETVADIQIEKKAATHTFVVLFADGTGKVYEAPKVGNDTEEFVAAFHA